MRTGHSPGEERVDAAGRVVTEKDLVDTCGAEEGARQWKRDRPLVLPAPRTLLMGTVRTWRPEEWIWLEAQNKWRDVGSSGAIKADDDAASSYYFEQRDWHSAEPVTVGRSVSFSPGVRGLRAVAEQIGPTP